MLLVAFADNDRVSHTSSHSCNDRRVTCKLMDQSRVGRLVSLSTSPALSFFWKGGLSAISISARASATSTQVRANQTGQLDTSPVEPCSNIQIPLLTPLSFPPRCQIHDEYFCTQPVKVPPDRRTKMRAHHHARRAYAVYYYDTDATT